VKRLFANSAQQVTSPLRAQVSNKKPPQGGLQIVTVQNPKTAMFAGERETQSRDNTNSESES
jgi:hypothetical protein